MTGPVTLREKLFGVVVALLLIAVCTLLVQMNEYHSSAVLDRNGKTEVLCQIDRNTVRPGQQVTAQCRTK